MSAILYEEVVLTPMDYGLNAAVIMARVVRHFV